MASSTRRGTAALALTGLVALSACASGGEGEPIEGGTFVLALGTDVGSLDPHLGAASSGLAAARFAYDPLVHMSEDGEIVSGLASDWEVDGLTVTLTLRDDVTCADGSAFTASTAAGNIAFIADPENASPLLGAFVPAGVTAEADDEAGVLTLAGPAPFVLQGLSNVGMVCDAGLADRDALVEGTDGTGPFTISEVVANDHYTYEVRDDYAWGPDGATTDEPGVPAVVELRVIPNETTAANLLVSGEIDAVRIVGPDRDRLQGMEMAESAAITGETWFNQAEGRIAADADVRLALAQALDVGELANVITSGTGGPATQLAVAAPAACTDGDFTSALPESSMEAAAETLESAGWQQSADGWERDGEPLTISFVYDSALGAGGDAAAELATASWQELGVDVTTSSMPTDELAGVLFSGGDWDVAWEPLNVNTPDQLLGFLGGAGPEEGGTNFASIANDAYDELAAEAMSLEGTESCDTWFEAEAALVERVDVLPFAESVLPIYANGVEFEGADTIVPTSIRLLG